MRLSATCLLLFLILTSWAQDRYAVYFTDKQQNNYQLSSPEEFLTQRSIDRRERWGIPLTEEDLPVSDNYLQAVTLTGAEIFYTSKWLNLAFIQVTESQLSEIEALSFVKEIHFAAPDAPLQKSGRVSRTKRKEEVETDVTSVQKDMLGLLKLPNEEIFGEGIYIANLDIGFQGIDQMPFQYFFPGQLIDGFNFVNNSFDILTGGTHGTLTLSPFVAHIDNTYLPLLPSASYLLYVTEDGPTEYRAEEYYWLFAAERADSLGVDVITSSLGYFDFDDASMNYTVEDLNGNTAVITKAANFATERGIIVVTSAGNQGNKAWTKITFPSDCFSCLAVGSVNEFGIRSEFSSVGPTADGRTKPDVMALGESVALINGAGNLVFSNGTSYAAPQVAAFLAGLLELYPEVSPFELVALMKETSSNAIYPNNEYGWGIPYFERVQKRIEAITNAPEIQVYPTIVENGNLTIGVSNPDEIKELFVEISNTKGQLIYRGTLPFEWQKAEYKLELKLSAGLYIVNCMPKNGNRFIQRIVVRQ